MQNTQSHTSYKQNLRERILDVAMAQFKQHGVKAVKMDDIAQHLSISKRTLYEIYGNKEDLLLECIVRERELNERHMVAFDCEGHTVMDVIIEFYRQRLSDIRHVNPLLLIEAHKYKKVVAFFEHSKEASASSAKAFFSRGVAEGYFRDDLNYDIVLTIGEAFMNYMMENKMYEDFSMQEIFRNVVAVLLRGYCTEKGIKELEERL